MRYHGVDIAIPGSAPNLIEMDIIEEPVSFRGQTFDVWDHNGGLSGTFEYLWLSGKAPSEAFNSIHLT